MSSMVTLSGRVVRISHGLRHSGYLSEVVLDDVEHVSRPSRKLAGVQVFNSIVHPMLLSCKVGDTVDVIASEMPMPQGKTNEWDAKGFSVIVSVGHFSRCEKIE